MSAHPVHITIDHTPREITPGLTLGQVLIQMAGLTGHEQLLLEVPDDIDVPVDPHDAILIMGGEGFSIGKGEPPIEDNPCLRLPIRFHFNGKLIDEDNAFHHPKATGAELKRLDPNLQPGDSLFADLPGFADEPIPDDLRIILRHKDRFIVVPCGNVGSEDLLAQHLTEVQSVFPRAHLLENAGNRYLVVPDVSLPVHWSSSEATLLAIIPNGYPMAALDMFWMDPELRLSDGRSPAGASTGEQHLGRPWQRFSWHYTGGQNGWRLGQSSLLSHLRFCQSRLAQAV